MGDLAWLEHIGSAAAGGATSLLAALASAAKQYKELKISVENLTRQHESLSEETVRNSAIVTWKQTLEAEVRQKVESLVNDRIDAIKRGFRLEIDGQKDDIDRKLRDLGRSTAPDLPTLEELRRRQNAFEDKLDRLRDDLRDETGGFVKQQIFLNFVEEQGRQWNEMNRSLGQIMGEMRRRPTPAPTPK